MRSSLVARLRLLLPLLLLATGLAAGALAAPGSATPSALRTGAGYSVGGGFVGYYLTRGGVKVYCIDPGKRAPSTVSLTTVHGYRGMSRRAASEIAFALRTWGDAHGRNAAATESQLVNTLAGNRSAVGSRARSLPRTVNAAVAARLRIVRARSGPYSLWVGVPRALLPGQTSTGGIRLTAGRTGVPGVLVRLTAGGNVTVPTALRTGSRGTAPFRYTVTAPGPVTIHAVADGLAPTWFTGTHPAAGQQRMITWSRALSASASSTSEAHPAGFSHAYSCTTTCNGHPHTTLGACAAAGTYPARIVFRAGGVTRAVDIAPAARSRCASTQVVLADRDQVTATWQFLGPRGWTAPVPAAGTFVVDCPPVPAVDLALHADCEHAGVTAAVFDRTSHPVVLVVAGAATMRIAASPGAVARFSAVVPCGRSMTYRVQAGIQRSGGGFNYGAAATVTTPGIAGQP